MNIRKFIANNRGEGYIDVCIIVLATIMVIALMMTVIPVLIAKNQLDNFADELAREPNLSAASARKHRRGKVFSANVRDCHQR
ncbi:MAG: DUF4320 family protein [Eubacterium sp.]|nr:DUF4320 family protein [Eubacterium sp.]